MTGFLAERGVQSDLRPPPNGPGTELPARECTTSHRPDAGESSRVPRLAVSGGRQLEGPAGRAVAGQLQCSVGRLDH